MSSQGESKEFYLYDGPTTTAEINGEETALVHGEVLLLPTEDEYVKALVARRLLTTEL